MSFVASDSVKETDFEGSYWKLTAFPYHCRNLLFFFSTKFKREKGIMETVKCSVYLTILPNETVQKCSFLNSNTPSRVDAYNNRK